MVEKEQIEKETMNSENITPEEENQKQQEEMVSEESMNHQEPTADTLSEEEKLRAEIRELKDKYLRLYSEFENYRKRTSKERLELIKTASEDVLKDIIPVMDDFERAYKGSENEENPQKIRDGNQLIYKKLEKILGIKGLQEMEDLVGKPFDADTQETITQIPSPNEEMKGKVIDVVEKGYTLGDKVVRYAKVVIGS
jgi:molecular chaperone GrpE